MKGHIHGKTQKTKKSQSYLFLKRQIQTLLLIPLGTPGLDSDLQCDQSLAGSVPALAAQRASALACKAWPHPGRIWRWTLVLPEEHSNRLYERISSVLTSRLGSLSIQWPPRSLAWATAASWLGLEHIPA